MFKINLPKNQAAASLILEKNARPFLHRKLKV
jgi:hypothetical protein